MQKGYYIYPAVFTYADDGISIRFPDLNGCLPCAMTEESALKNAQEAMTLYLSTMEDDKEIIPEPTRIKNIHVSDNETIMLIEAYLPSYRSLIKYT